LVPIVVPIVAFITLAAWLSIVYWANKYPDWKPTGEAMRRIRQFLSTAIAKRPVRFAGGIAVAAVPAYFTFIPPEPGTTGWPIRVLIMTGWLIVLIFGVFIASAHDISIDRLAAGFVGARTAFREAAAVDILKRLLSPADNVAKGYSWALYVPDRRNPELLVPIPQLGNQAATRWPVGKGVTGVAYDSKELQIGQDEQLKPDGKFGPQPGQSLHLQRYRTVVAQPVMSASRKVLAVLTAATTTGQRELVNDEGRTLLLRLANDISRVLIDMLGFEE
jgi:hypothetical protein